MTNNLKGILLMIMASMILPLIDVSAKHLGNSLPTIMLVLSRFLLQALIILPTVWRKLYLPKGRELKLHLVRTFSLGVASACLFVAVIFMPIIDALAVLCAMPLITTLLAPMFLGETLDLKRFLGVVTGFCGALAIIQPGFGVLGWPSLLPLASAISSAGYIITTRILAREAKASARMMQFFSGAFGTAMALVFVLILLPLELPVLKLTMPEIWQWKYLFLIGVSATLGHMLITTACKLASASTLVPYQYTELLSGGIFGWLIFGDIPSLTTWIGSSILVLSGIYIWRLERSAKH